MVGKQHIIYLLEIDADTFLVESMLETLLNKNESDVLGTDSGMGKVLDTTTTLEWLQAITSLKSFKLLLCFMNSELKAKILNWLNDQRTSSLTHDSIISDLIIKFSS